MNGRRRQLSRGVLAAALLLSLLPRAAAQTGTPPHPRPEKSLTPDSGSGGGELPKTKAPNGGATGKTKVPKVPLPPGGPLPSSSIKERGFVGGNGQGNGGSGGGTGGDTGGGTGGSGGDSDGGATDGGASNGNATSGNASNGNASNESASSGSANSGSASNSGVSSSGAGVTTSASSAADAGDGAAAPEQQFLVEVPADSASARETMRLLCGDGPARGVTAALLDAEGRILAVAMLDASGASRLFLRASR